MLIPPTRDPNALQEEGIGHVNLNFSPLDYFSTGIEYMYGTKRATNDELGRASRIQMMMKFSFWEVDNCEV